MRRISLLSLIPLVAAAPLAAQGFEGVVSVKMSGMGGGGNSDTDFSVKNDRMVGKMLMPANTPMAGKEGKIIIDANAGTVTMLMPMAMGNMQGMKMVTDVKKAAENAKIDVKALGTSATIAGYKCDDFQVTEGKNVTVVCISSQLGRFAMSGMGATSAWASVLVSHPGFPLRVVANGKTNFEVTAVRPGPVSSDLFTIPDGYMDMGGMGGMRGGRGGGL